MIVVVRLVNHSLVGEDGRVVGSSGAVCSLCVVVRTFWVLGTLGLTIKTSSHEL